MVAPLRDELEAALSSTTTSPTSGPTTTEPAG